MASRRTLPSSRSGVHPQANAGTISSSRVWFPSRRYGETPSQTLRRALVAIMLGLAQELDDAVEGAHFLLGHVGALQQRPEVVDHRRSHRLVAQEARLIERALEMVEQVLQLVLGCRP